jgi:nucleoside-diphosphate-sugar epimerase
MKALVTGASGFIGSTLVEELDTLGFEVCALMRNSASLENLEGLRYQRIEGDLSRFDSLCHAVDGVDYVFHLAGVTQVARTSSFFEINAQGTANLARAVAQVRPGLSRFIYVSSLAAAGPSLTLRPRIESEDNEPVSNYGRSKLQGEKELLRYEKVFPISIVRPPWVYGPRDKAILFLVQTLAKNLMPVLQGATRSRQKYYSMIHAQDLCRGIVQAAVVPLHKVPSGEVFYLAGDEIHTYQEFMLEIAEKLNCDPLKIKIPISVVKLAALGLSALGRLSHRTFPLNLDKLSEIVPDYWICSNQKAKSLLGFSPAFDLSSGIAHSIEWYKRQRWI